MKANYATRDRQKVQLTEITESTYIAFQNAALQTLVEDFHWGTNVRHAKEPLRIKRFDELTNDIFADFLKGTLSADNKAALVDIIFADGYHDPQKNSGFVANLQSLLIFCQMLALKRVAGFGNDRLTRFSDLAIARYPAAVQRTGLSEKSSSSDNDAVEKNIIEQPQFGYVCEWLPKTFYAQVGKFILNLPHLLKELQYDQSWRVDLQEKYAALDE